MDHPRPGLRYVAAKDLDKSGVKFDGLDVNGTDGEKLGEVDGFIIDVVKREPRHVAVEAGWFIHKRFLIPIGLVRWGGDRKALSADVTKERVERFPGFDRGEFEKFNAVEVARFDGTIGAVWGAGCDAGELDSHYHIPDWWDATFYR